eukprot:527450-Hanusia_phi.AAC.2
MQVPKGYPTLKLFINGTESQVVAKFVSNEQVLRFPPVSWAEGFVVLEIPRGEVAVENRLQARRAFTVARFL